MSAKVTTAVVNVLFDPDCHALVNARLNNQASKGTLRSVAHCQQEAHDQQCEIDVVKNDVNICVNYVSDVFLDEVTCSLHLAHGRLNESSVNDAVKISKAMYQLACVNARC